MMKNWVELFLVYDSVLTGANTHINVWKSQSAVTFHQ